MKKKRVAQPIVQLFFLLEFAQQPMTSWCYTIRDFSPVNIPRCYTIEDFYPVKIPRCYAIEDFSPVNIPWFYAIGDFSPVNIPCIDAIEDFSPVKIPWFDAIGGLLPGKYSPNVLCLRKRGASKCVNLLVKVLLSSWKKTRCLIRKRQGQGARNSKNTEFNCVNE